MSQPVEARKLLDPKIVFIPAVYRYFFRGSNIYLVMEFVEGVVGDLIEDDESINRIVRIVEQLPSHQSNVPGPLGRGILTGLPRTKKSN